MIENKFPLASLVVVFYKQEKYVKDTIAGALSQTYQNLEIILSDDNSPDNTFEEIKDAVKNYHGPHKIIVNKNDTNLGLVSHVNKALFELSHGDYIFLNGGDDISLPQRVERGVCAFEDNVNIAAVTFSRIIIDKYGKEIGRVEVSREAISVIDKAYMKSYIFMAGGGALSLRRTLLDFFGRLNDDCQTEDSTLRFRALLLGGIMCLPTYGLKYRVHDNNISRRLDNFDTDAIVHQYEVDLLHVKDKLSRNLRVGLLNKIRFYRNYRGMLVAHEQANSLIQRGYLRIRMLCVKVIYRITVLMMPL